MAKKLTILDALAPTMIPHTTKYVPILDKHVLSKVFDQVSTWNFLLPITDYIFINLGEYPAYGI